jgi:hypothetical protein
MFAGFRAWLAGCKSELQTGLGRGINLQRLIYGSPDNQIDCRPPLGIGCGKTPPQAAVQLRIVVFPDAHARSNLLEVDRTVAKGKFKCAAMSHNVVQPASLLVIDGPATIE